MAKATMMLLLQQWLLWPWTLLLLWLMLLLISARGSTGLYLLEVIKGAALLWPAITISIAIEKSLALFAILPT
ncbi:MAG: hypothetical protein EOO38_18915 [Cytophagaceae bacterium]|nr:MAG: hypothetical protein EOO38_18915 [Cytophagaceae bacterium]